MHTPLDRPGATPRDAMADAGIAPPAEIIADGEIHRFKANGDRKPNAWYVAHPSDDGGIVCCNFGHWARGISLTWKPTGTERHTPEERAKWRKLWQQQQAERDAQKQQKADAASERAQDILAAAETAADDHPYLIRKRVKAYPGVKIGFWEQSRHPNSLLIPLSTLDGQVRTLQAIYPERDLRTGRDKDFLKGGERKSTCFTMGDLAESPAILLCEGYATGASLHEATHLATVCAMDAGNLMPVAMKLRATYQGKWVIVCGDNDRQTAGNPGQKAAYAVAKGYTWGVEVAIPSFTEKEKGSDFNDLAALHGLDAVREIVDAAVGRTKKRPRLSHAQPHHPGGAGPNGRPDDGPGRARPRTGANSSVGPQEASQESLDANKSQAEAQLNNRAGVIQVVPGSLAEMTDEAEAVLLKHDEIYQRGGYLARLITTRAQTVRGITRPSGNVGILPLDVDYLLDRLNRLILWQKLKEGELVACNAPRGVATALLARSGWWHFQPLTGVITAPTLRPDGSILDAPGYDAATGLMFVSDQPFEPIPHNPTFEQARVALSFLKEEVLIGFPFAEPHDKSAAESAVLTAAVRHALPHAPMHTFSAPRMASGKTLLTDVVSLIATGRTATLMTYTADPDEQRKRILSVLMQGDNVINLDNVEEPLQGDSLCAVLTSETFTDRLLGTNRTITAPTSCTWLATGNNLQVKGDITTRIVPCVLDPRCEHPEEREFERNLRDWIPAHRSELVRACLIVLRAYIVAGKPRQPIKTFGRFEEWSGLIRSALVWLDEADPLAGRAQLEDADPVRERLRALLFAWWRTFHSASATVKELRLKADETERDNEGNERYVASDLRETLSEHFCNRQGEISSQVISEFLKRFVRRIEIGARFEAAADYGTRAQWRIVIQDQAAFKRAMQKFSDESKKAAQAAKLDQQTPQEPNNGAVSDGLQPENAGCKIPPSANGSDMPAVQPVQPVQPVSARPEKFSSDGKSDDRGEVF